jgi:hypothetical protein
LQWCCSEEATVRCVITFVNSEIKQYDFFLGGVFLVIYLDVSRFSSVFLVVGISWKFLFFMFLDVFVLFMAL